MSRTISVCLLALCTFACSKAPDSIVEGEPFGRGPYPVGSTNLEVAPAHVGIGDQMMQEYLVGQRAESGQSKFIADILRYPEAAWVTDVAVPDVKGLYGPASGKNLPIVTFVVYPEADDKPQRRYSFPYHDAAFGSFEAMLDPGEKPRFADAKERYPLIIISHGLNVHGLYDVAHAHDLASHGYIVAVINYGDERTAIANDRNLHVGFLRPLITKAVLDSLLESEEFGAHIDADNIGISGVSYGGFTALALAGAKIDGNDKSVSDRRFKAALMTVPWVGGTYDFGDYFGFGSNNNTLARVDIPVIALYGTNDQVAHSSFTLPAMKKLSGPAYLVELVNQGHDPEGGSWEDRNNWELLFFSAFLKHDPASLEALKTTRSMKGGNIDIQRFDYQQLGSDF